LDNKVTDIIDPRL